jgi:D-alanyl-D-alanine carboxypeptidase
VMGAQSSAGRALKAAQLLERGFSSNSGVGGWLTPSLGTVESLQPISAEPPNLREEMCGNHRKRQATEDEDEVLPAATGADSPYAAFLASLRTPKTKSAALMQESTLGEPVLVYTGTKPPAPGALQAGWGEPAKPKAKKSKGGTATASKEGKPSASDGKPKAAKDKDGAAPTAAATSSEGAPPKPKPKKPAPKTSPAAATTPTPVSATQQTTQAR